MNDDARHLNELVTRKAESLRQLPDPSTLSDQAAFMSAGVQVMDVILTLGKISVSVPRPTGRGYTRRHAPLVGLAVRLVKLYDGYLSQLVATGASWRLSFSGRSTSLTSSCSI